MRYLDANVFIRYLIKDDEAKAERCMALFDRLSRNEEEVVTCESVVAEVVFVLSSRRQYDLPADEIVRLFRPLLELRGIKLSGKSRCVRALEIYAQRPSLGFEDAVIAAHMEADDIDEIYSYDHHFDGFDRKLQRLEP